MVYSRIALFILLGSSAYVGCGGESPSGSVDKQSGPTNVTGLNTSERVGEVLTTLSTPDGHTFEFGRTATGDLVVGENVPLGQRAVLEDPAMRGDVTDVYTALANGAEIPEVLKVAQAQAVASTAAAAKAPLAAPTKAPPTRTIIKTEATSGLTGNQSWFQSAICSQGTIQVCDLGSGSQNTQLYQWEHAPNFYAYALNDSSNTTAATMQEYVWNGSAWVHDWTSGAINPGSYWYFNWWNSGPVYRAADITIQSGPTGFAEGGVTPTCSAQGGVAGDLSGGPNPSVWGFNTNGFQNDTSHGTNVSISLSGDPYVVRYQGPLGIIGSNGIESGGKQIADSTCPEDNVYNSNNVFTVTFVGVTTGQTCTATTTNPWFSPNNCCASKGGANTHC